MTVSPALFPSRPRWSPLLVGLAAAAAMIAAAAAEPLRALPEGKLPADRRLGPLKDLNGYFPFTPPASPTAWAKRAEYVRRQILVSQGLWPMPEKTPLNAVIHGRVEREDFTVDKVFFESTPGFFVTGNLYRPKGKTGKLPGVLCPHGHWPQGRFTDAGPEKILKDIVDGAERFEDSGRSPLQARCVTLARMGCVVFHYDMLGYADSTQLSYDLVHRFGKQRPEMNSPEVWGFYGTQAESRLQSVMGLQSLNSVRALDFLLALPDVDASRVGVTGASGGGTQTFMLGAIDPRPTVAFPAVMVSTAMQGGCTCENSSLLRVDTGNIEFAAMFAPKPLGMTAANDWTKEMETKGFPELKKHYQMLGVPNNVFLKPSLHFGHNYNYVSRAAMYSWMNKHLKLGLKEPVVEQDFRRLTEAEMSVWDATHPKPPGGPEFERKLTAWLTADADKQLAAARATPEKYRQLVGGALEVMIGRTLEQVGATEWVNAKKEDRGSYLEMSGLVRATKHGEELPAVFLYPKQWKGRTVVWAHDLGKAGLYGADGAPVAAVRTLLDAGATVMGVDLFGQGEFQASGKPLEKARRVNNTRDFTGYTQGYNPSVFAERTRDLLTVVAFVRNYDKKTKTLDLAGVGGRAGAWVAAARALAGDAVQHAAVDTAGFRFTQISEWQDPAFLPGGAKYDDLPGLLALSAPGKLWLAGEGLTAPDAVRAAYASAAGALTVAGKADEAAAVKWLLAE